MLKQQKLMKKASLSLPPVLSSPNGLPIHFLSGKNYLYQTLFCIYSLTRVTKTEFKFILIDDGSFDESLIKKMNHHLPGAIIITKSIIEENLRNILPQPLYPYLHRKRKEYPHIKKLTDIHTLQDNSWKLVLDSDMLFWDEPKDLIDWLNKPIEPLHMVDCEQSYGYSNDLMETLSHSTISPLINVGAIGLNSKYINWSHIESWAKEMEEKEGAKYYLEQALSAMIIGDKKSTILKTESGYLVNPLLNDIIEKKGVLHHYVDTSKEGYFKYAWINVLNS